MNSASAYQEPVVTLLCTLRRMDYIATIDGARRLRLHGPSSRLPPEIEQDVREHRDELVRLVEKEIVVDELEVFAMAREIFGTSERGAA